MKLLIYSHYFAPSIGGVETIVASLARGLALREGPHGDKFELIVVTQTPRGSFNDSALPFTIYRQPGMKLLLKLIANSDLVHVAGPAWMPMFASILTRRPFVVEHHGFLPICPNGQLCIATTDSPCPGHFRAGNHVQCWRCNSREGWGSSFGKWLFTFVRRFLCTFARTNIVPTDDLSRQLSLPRSHTIPHGIPARPVVKSETLDPPVIAFQGRLVPTKGARLLLDAAAILKDQGARFQIRIIGGGPEAAALAVHASTRGIEETVRFLGSLSPSDLELQLSAASVVVVPSLGGEVFGLVVVENMDRGLPVVAADLGAFVEVLGGCGFLFRVGDAADLASRILGVLEDRTEALRIGLSAKNRAERLYREETMIEAHATIYNRILGT